MGEPLLEPRGDADVEAEVVPEGLSPFAPLREALLEGVPEVLTLAEAEAEGLLDPEVEAAGLGDPDGSRVSEGVPVGE